MGIASDGEDRDSSVRFSHAHDERTNANGPIINSHGQDRDANGENIATNVRGTKEVHGLPGCNDGLPGCNDRFSSEVRRGIAEVRGLRGSNDGLPREVRGLPG
jgi:hypothetical protein